MEELRRKSFLLRKDVLDIVYNSKAGHIGGDFSVLDILNILYNKHMNITPENFSEIERDHFILSKGHCVESLYAVLCDKGFFDKENLKTVSTFNSIYIGHPTNKVNGIEMNSGSLGHGLSVGVGMALAQKMDNSPNRVYVVMGDGELLEGSVWEAVMSATHYKLNNLIAIIDRNKLQISGTTEEVLYNENLDERFSAFGFNVIEAYGNDYNSLNKALNEAKNVEGKPTVIICNTTKGYGVSFMENQKAWHHKVPSDEQYELAKKELLERSVANE